MYYSSATAGFTGHEKAPVNQTFFVLLSQFYQRFTNISGETGLLTITPEWGEQQCREAPLPTDASQRQDLVMTDHEKVSFLMLLLIFWPVWSKSMVLKCSKT